MQDAYGDPLSNRSRCQFSDARVVSYIALMHTLWPAFGRRSALGLFAGSGAALFVALLEPDWKRMDSSDVVALVAVLVSGVVGVASLISGQFSASKDRQLAAALAQQDRRQARLESAYVELLTFAER